MKENNSIYLPASQGSPNFQLIFPANFIKSISESQQKLKDIFALPELQKALKGFKETQLKLKDLFSSPTVVKAIEESKKKMIEQKTDYEKKLESLKHYLAAKGYFLPEDTEGFFNWYHTEKVGHLSLYEGLERKVIDSDFIEYSIWRERKMKSHLKIEKPIPLAANFSFVNEPQPTIEECVNRLFQVAHNASGKDSSSLDWEVNVLYNVKTMVLYDESITTTEQNKYLKRLDLIESMLKEKRQKAQEREREEDEYRISKGLEPKYKVSKEILDYIFDRNIDKEQSLNKNEETYYTTIPDRIIRELSIIETIFKAQSLKYDENDSFLFILDHRGKSGIDGRYIAALDIFSDVELFNLQLYKQHFTERFENSSNHTLLNNQLAQIKQKAKQVTNYYDTHLTVRNKLAKDYVEKKNNLQPQESVELLERHSAVATIYCYQLMTLYLGANRMHKPTGMNRNYSFSYISDNPTLVSICHTLIEFIDKLQKPNKATQEKPSYLGYALLHYYWHKFSKEKTVQINLKTYRKWANNYSLKDAKQLWKYAKPMLEDEPKPANNHNSKTAYGKQYKLILPLLNNSCEPAFCEVERKFEKLKRDNPSLNF